MKKAIIAVLAVVGSSTAAMADNHSSGTQGHRVQPASPITSAARTSPRGTVSVARPVVTTRPVVTRPVPARPVAVSVPRPVASQGRDRDRGGSERGGSERGGSERGRDGERGGSERGHGPVVRPVVIRPTVYQPTYYHPVSYQPVYTQPDYDDYRYVSPVAALPDSYTNGWIDLTAPTSLVRGREIIQLGAQVGPIDTLMLQADAGATNIDTVQVQFVDGGSQQFSVRQTIDMGNPELTINLGHRDVASLIIYGQAGVGATYQVLAR